MDILHKMVFPVRRVWFRVKSRKNGGGLLKLRNDVQTCEYEDVQVMWEMLRKSESQQIAQTSTKRKIKPFWRVFVWSHGRTPPPPPSSSSSSPFKRG